LFGKKVIECKTIPKPQNREAPLPPEGGKRWTELMNNKQKYKLASLLPLWGLGAFKNYYYEKTLLSFSVVITISNKLRNTQKPHSRPLFKDEGRNTPSFGGGRGEVVFNWQ
jgi:hypothetical protein